MDTVRKQIETDTIPVRKMSGYGFFSGFSSHDRRVEEMIIIFSLMIGIIHVIQHSVLKSYSWFIVPAVLVMLTIIPAILRKSDFKDVGLVFDHTLESLRLVCRISVVVFPSMYLGLWLIRKAGFPLPYQPVWSQGQNPVTWLIYQFMYVAVAEEIFFRGYLQTTIEKLCTRWSPRFGHWSYIPAMVLSAAGFALAHMLLSSRWVALWTFFPGLILGWMFIRTRSLLAPILFHGLSNTVYLVMSAHLG